MQFENLDEGIEDSNMFINIEGPIGRNFAIQQSQISSFNMASESQIS
jgi:hypothetical protein